MSDDMQDQLQKLVRAVADLEKASRQALGVLETIEYRDIVFYVTKRFVIADVTPIAYFDLVERIQASDAATAVVCLYDRLAPLLTCRHKWTRLKRESDASIRSMSKGWMAGSDGPQVCRACTAYALGGPTVPLPVVGRQN